MKRVLITGGHLTPALSVIDRIRAEGKPWSLGFVGRRYAFEGKRAETEEYRLVTGRGIPFSELTSGRLQRTLSLEAVGSLLKVPLGFIGAMRVLETEKPDLVVSFGGYLAVPVVVAAWLKGIPSVTHEQTRVPGLANRIISKFTRRVLTTFPSVHSLGGSRTECIGLPLRPEIGSPPAKPSFRIPDGSYPIIYITGGSTGAVTLNERLLPGIVRLLPRFTIIHQTGKLFIGKATDFGTSLPESVRGRYLPVAYADAGDVSWIMHHAHMLVGRSGANTVVESLVCGLPAVYVPLPWAAGNEQYENAKFAVSHHAAKIVPQDSLTPDTVVAAVEGIAADRDAYVAGTAAAARQIPADADVRFVAVIERILTEA